MKITYITILRFKKLLFDYFHKINFCLVIADSTRCNLCHRGIHVHDHWESAGLSFIIGKSGRILVLAFVVSVGSKYSSQTDIFKFASHFNIS